jgi:hypothetical protein
VTPRSRFGGSATIVSASDYVSSFRGEGVEPDLVALPVGLRFDVSRGMSVGARRRCPVRAGLLTSRDDDLCGEAAYWWWRGGVGLVAIGQARHKCLATAGNGLGLSIRRLGAAACLCSHDLMCGRANCGPSAHRAQTVGGRSQPSGLTGSSGSLFDQHQQRDVSPNYCS